MKVLISFLSVAAFALPAQQPIGQATGTKPPAIDKAGVKDSTKPPAVQSAEGQPAPTRIGRHQINETIQQWYEQEPEVSPPAKPQSEIAPHQIGETFAEWLRINQIDLNDICQPHKRGDKRVDYKAVCKKLSTMRDTGYGDFYTKNESGSTFGWRFVDGRVGDYSVNEMWHSTVHAPDPEDKGNKLHTTANDRAYEWTFADGKLSEVSVTPNWKAIYKIYSEEGLRLHPEVVPGFQEEVNLLTQIYGKPSTLRSVPYHNAYGAQWEASVALWEMPDGTQIVAFEDSTFGNHGRLLAVNILSKEALGRMTQPQSKPNPYGHY